MNTLKTKTKILSILLIPLFLFSTNCGKINNIIDDIAKETTDVISKFTTKIHGKVTLPGKTNHSGIQVNIYKQSSSMTQSVGKSLASTKTDSDGNFSLKIEIAEPKTSSLSTQSLETGYYTVVYSKEGYHSQTVKNVPVIFGTSDYLLDDIFLNKKSIMFELSYYNSNPKLLFASLNLEYNNEELQLYNRGYDVVKNGNITTQPISNNLKDDMIDWLNDDKQLKKAIVQVQENISETEACGRTYLLEFYSFPLYFNLDELEEINN